MVLAALQDAERAARLERERLEELALGSISHHFAPSQERSEVYMKRTVIPKGAHLQQHRHTYDHASVVVEGEAMVGADGIWQIVRAGAVLVLKAGTAHEVRALERTVWYCIHPTNENDPERVDEVLIAPACCEPAGKGGA